MSSPVEPTEYCIAFETKKDKGYIRAVKVKLYEDILDELETVRIDLADHPLYPKLVEYVRNNPR